MFFVSWAAWGIFRHSQRMIHDTKILIVVLSISFLFLLAPLPSIDRSNESSKKDHETLKNSLDDWKIRLITGNVGVRRWNLKTIETNNQAPRHFAYDLRLDHSTQDSRYNEDPEIPPGTVWNPHQFDREYRHVAPSLITSDPGLVGRGPTTVFYWWETNEFRHLELY